MDETVARQLVALNAAFYARFAAAFAASRAEPQPGYERLLPYIHDGAAVLDVGCGEGRFGRFLRSRGLTVAYSGVDGSADLLRLAEEVGGRFAHRDLFQPDCLRDLGPFDFVACLSTLQHIPGRERRARLLAEMRDRLGPGGHIALANWQFLGSERQRRKLRPWAEAGLGPEAVEPGDYLLSWQRGGYGLRYVALLDEAGTQELAQEAGLRIVEQFRSDGREGDLNLYTLLANPI